MSRSIRVLASAIAFLILALALAQVPGAPGPAIAAKPTPTPQPTPPPPPPPIPDGMRAGSARVELRHHAVPVTELVGGLDRLDGLALPGIGR